MGFPTKAMPLAPLSCSSCVPHLVLIIALLFHCVLCLLLLFSGRGLREGGPRAGGRIIDHPWVQGPPNGSKGILREGPRAPLGSHGDPMGSNIGIPGLPLGIPRDPLGIPWDPPWDPRDPRGEPRDP